MKCIICNSTDIELKKLNEEIKSRNNIVLIPMEIMVCNNCGERYYNRQNIQRIEELRDKLKNKKLSTREVGKVLIANL